MHRLAGRLILAVAMLVAIAAYVTPAEAANTAGKVQFVKRTDPSFDRFTFRPTDSFPAWMRGKFWRSEVFTPYFDRMTAWYPQGWVYWDLYAIYNPSGMATTHPDWILKDAADRPLYIPWGCDGTTCPQYAADPGSPAFRQMWIDRARTALARGYRGIWLDDVNLEFRVSDATERQVAPIDPRTGQAMTAAAWRGYIVSFVEEIRRALPGAEILHNSIWFAGSPGRDADVTRQVAAADYVNLERGVNDDGLTGGTGRWSLNAFLEHVDRIHAAGKGVIFDGGDNSAQGREYSLASYFLVTNGNDGVGNDKMTPENWWSGYDVNLGASTGDRAAWQGLLRRDFSAGMSLVNGPDAPTRTVALPVPMVTTDGRTVTAVTLPARSGAVLRTVDGAAPPTGSAAGGGATTTVPPPTPSAGRTVRVDLRTKRSRRAVAVTGKVSPVSTGKVVLSIERKRGMRWVAVRRDTAKVAAGRFAARMTRLRPGRYRVHATFRPRSHAATAFAAQAFSLRG